VPTTILSARLPSRISRRQRHIVEAESDFQESKAWKRAYLVDGAPSSSPRSGIHGDAVENRVPLVG